MSARKTNGHGQDNLDTLSSACYTIPWQPKRRNKSASALVDHESEGCFPVLAEFEVDDAPARVRFASYKLAIQKIDALFDSCVQRAFSSLFEDLRFFFHPTTSQDDDDSSNSFHVAEADFFLPGLQSHNQTQRRSKSIPTALLISTSAPWLSSFSNRLVSQISQGSDDGAENVIVTLSSSECTNLHTALRLLVARFIAQARLLVPHESPHDAQLTSIETAAINGKIEPDLHLLGEWWAARFGQSALGPGVVLNLPAIETIEPSVLSDLLSALQAYVAESRDDDDLAMSPAFTLILGVTSPSGGLQTAAGSGASSSSAPAPWIDYIPRHVLRVLDISRFALPSKESVWSQLVQLFLVSRHLPLSLGPSTFEYVRQTYWEKDADLDSVLDAVRLACFLHFSGKPEAVFTIPQQARHIHVSSWTPKMLQRIQTSFLAVDEDSDGLVFPLLIGSSGEDERFDLDAFLHRITQSSDYLLQIVDQISHTRQVLSFRIELAVRFLSRAFESLQKIQSKATTAAQAIQARNTSSSAVAAAAIAAQQAGELEEQRHIERASDILTQVVSQCLIASVGTIDRSKPPPNALLLTSGLARLCNAARRLLSDEFEELLDELVAVAEEEVRKMQNTLTDEADDTVTGGEKRIQSASQIMTAQSESFLADLRTFQQRLAQTIAVGSVSFDEEDMHVVPLTSANGDADGPAQQKREARLQRVQRKLLMEEKLLGLKREITNWIVQFVTNLVDWKVLAPRVDFGPLHLLKDIFWINSYDPLSTLLDPSARAGMSLPLTEPLEFLESLYDAALSVVPPDTMSDIDLSALQNADTPDVCRIYQLYRECGKFVNLADWYDAFKQSVELDEALRSVDEDLRNDLNEAQARKAAAISDDAQLGLTADDDNTDEDGGGNRRDSAVEDDDSDGADALPQTPSRRNDKRKRQSRSFDATDSDDGSDVMDTPSKRPKRAAILRGRRQEQAQKDVGAGTQTQARFALAINELARMGMLRGTRRRAEHITKVMWDLVPETF